MSIIDSQKKFMNQLYNSILEKISCWFRSKPPVHKISDNGESSLEQQHIYNLYNNKYCGFCYNFLDSNTILSQLQQAKIRNKTYQFCSEYCYEDWLKTPGNR